MPKIVKQSNKPVVRKKGGSVIDRIAPLGEGLDEGIKINLYGKSGSGKTVIWSTFPKPILALICSGGNKPGELRSINTAANRKAIKQVPIERSTEILELVEYQASSGDFATIVLDHASGLQDLILREILGRDELPAQLSWGLASQQQYGQLALQMKERLRDLLNLSCNVVIVAQEREFGSEGDNTDLIMPYVASALTPSVVGWLNPAVDYIVQAFKRPKMVEKETSINGKKIKTRQRASGVEYCIRTAPHDIFTTKFRLPMGCDLPEVIVDPTYDKIKAVIDQAG